MQTIEKQAEISAAVRAFMQKEPRLLIGGKWTASSGAALLPSYDPSTGDVLSWIVDACDEDVDRAVQAAREAFDDGRWTGLPAARREQVILKLADLIEANVGELAEIEALDNGKPLFMAARVDIPSAIAQIRYAAGCATKIAGMQTALATMPDNAFHAYTRREPIGVAALIVPWNFPLMMAAVKFAPALAAGCTIVLKPAELTSLSALRLGELIQEAGIPDGVMNIVTGRGETVGAALVRHPGVDKIAFTGSTLVGKTILRSAADTMKRVTLELGGKSPVLVMPDADVQAAAKGAAGSIFFNAGQVCVAGSRLYVHREIFDEVLEGVGAAANAMKLGPSLVKGSQIGPLVSSRQRERVLGYVDGAKKQGASVQGGEEIGDAGYFVTPAIIADVCTDMAVMREEVFGPVVCATRFDDFDDVIAQANDSPYGLAASVWTKDFSTMHRIAQRLKAGAVWGNCHAVIDPALPFGGYKQSGLGREQGMDGVLAYTETKSVILAL